MPLSGSRALAPVVVVLAAGRGSRFEGAVHKLRQSLGDESVLAATLAQVLQHTSGLPDYIKSPKFLKEFIANPKMEHRVVASHRFGHA